MNNKIRTFILLFMINTAWLFGNGPAGMDCTSYFTWEAVPGEDLTIQFTNLSTGQFNTWMWDFGDGNTSGVYNPVYQYSDFGTYYVCLTISDGANCNDIYCDTVVVTLECVANFDITYVPTTPPLVQFTDISSGAPNSWFWDFGDGTTSTEQNPVHAYYDPGEYDVCLIIEHTDSLFYCVDTICHVVSIPDSLECEAFFAYDIDEDDPLMLHFTDQSVGNITDWEWDFGDGSISTEQNPTHIFEKGGEYLVCLKVENNDTTANCLHFICKTIILDDSVHCQANFGAHADSNSNIMYRYSFMDMSTGNPDGWLWDFGDGNFSQEQNPVHAYQDAGTYEICLTSWNSNHPGCTDSYCGLIQTSNYFQLGGLAFIGENPLNNPYPTGDTGVAILYRMRGNQEYIPVDTNTFHELGYYWFSNMMEMDYIIRIMLSPGSAHYNDFIPSYFPSSMEWQQADIFMLNDNMFEMNTSLLQAVGPEAGPGRISGRVITGNRVEAYRSFHDVPVILSNAGSTPLAWTLTDEFGQFEFNSLGYGHYQLHADIPGVWSHAETIIIDENMIINDTAWIRMYHESPFSIIETDLLDIRITNLYPNPVIDELNIQYFSERNTHIQISVTNLIGQSIFSQGYEAHKGSNTTSFSTKAFPPGLYLISITGEGQKQSIKKFIKK